MINKGRQEEIVGKWVSAGKNRDGEKFFRKLSAGLALPKVLRILNLFPVRLPVFGVQTPRIGSFGGDKSGKNCLAAFPAIWYGCYSMH